MASNAISGVGTKIYRRAAGEWLPMAEVNSISGPGMSRETIDVTSLDSNAGYREFISGIRDAGTVSLSMNFTNDTYSQAKADFESDVANEYKIVVNNPTQTTLQFSGLVTELPLNIEVADKISADVTIKISGAVTLTDGITPTATNPTATYDSSMGNTPGGPVSLDILANDLLADGTPASSSNSTVALIDPATNDIPANPHEVTVAGEGTWTYDPDTGKLTFTPETDLTGDPTSIDYIITELATSLSANATVTIGYAPTPTTTE